MGESLFQANGLNHEGKILGTTTHGTPTEHNQASNRFDLSSQFVPTDERGEWVEEDPPRNDQDKDAPDQQPPYRRKSSQEEGDWEDMRMKGCSTGRMTAVLSRGLTRETTAPKFEQENKRNDSESINRANLDPPALVEENEGWELQPRSTPLSKLMERHESFKNLSNMMKEMGGDTESRPTPKTRELQEPQ